MDAPSRVKTVGQQNGSPRRKLAGAVLNKGAIVPVLVQIIAPHQAIAENQVKGSRGTESGGVPLPKKNRQGFRVPPKPALAVRVMRKGSPGRHPYLQMFAGHAQERKLRAWCAFLRQDGGLQRVQANAAAQIQNAQRLSCKIREEALQKQPLARVSACVRAKAGRVGQGAEQRRQFLWQKLHTGGKTPRQRIPEVRQGRPGGVGERIRKPTLIRQKRASHKA